MKVTLSNESGKCHELVYRIHSRASAQQWARCLQKALPSGLREQNRFYCFPRQVELELKSTLSRLEELLCRLQQLHPELDFPRLNHKQIWESVNELHRNFAHGHLMADWSKKENESLWSEFNVILHAIESSLFNMKTAPLTGINLARIVFTWNDNAKTPLEENFYEDFHCGYHFGHAYLNYSQVGRHLWEMFFSKDDGIPDEHIQPFRYSSGDTHLYFGPDSGHLLTENRMAQIKEWFEERKNRFERLGLRWGDPKLALGLLPVAQLEDAPISTKEVIHFQKELDQFTFVKSVNVE